MQFNCQRGVLPDGRPLDAAPSPVVPARTPTLAVAVHVARLRPAVGVACPRQVDEPLVDPILRGHYVHRPAAVPRRGAQQLPAAGLFKGRLVEFLVAEKYDTAA